MPIYQGNLHSKSSPSFLNDEYSGPGGTENKLPKNGIDGGEGGRRSLFLCRLRYCSRSKTVDREISAVYKRFWENDMVTRGLFDK
jgi:hypothetical protein